VGGGPDDWAPLVSLWCLKEKERRCELGRRGAGWADAGRLRAGGKGRWPGSLRGQKEKKKKGWGGQGERREERERGLSSFFKKILFKFVFQTFEIGLFSKHSKIFKTFLKAF
jgi:hypothetical protein